MNRLTYLRHPAQLTRVHSAWAELRHLQPHGAVISAALGRLLTTPRKSYDFATSTKTTHSGPDQYSNQRRRKVLGLPEELCSDVLALTCDSSTAAGVCHVYVVGTIHDSIESCRQVKAVISYVQPQIIFLEQCSGGKGLLTRRNWKVPTVGEMIRQKKGGYNLFQILLNWAYAMRAATNGFYLGSEFRVAYEEAVKYKPYCVRKLVLGDRPVEITLKRTWRLLPLLHKIKLIFFPLFYLPSFQDIKEMLEEGDGYDMVKFRLQKMKKEFPTIFQTLVDERDQCMSSALLRVASKHSSVVAIVGKGHLPGIKKHWKQQVEMKDLLKILPQKPPISCATILKAMFGRWFRK